MRCAWPVAIAFVIAVRTARADGELVLARDALLARLSLEVDLTSRRVADQLALAPDAWLGVTPRWTVGLIHSNAAIDRIASDASLCLRGCDRPYATGLDARWSWLRGPLAVAPRARLLVRSVDPWKPAATLGALARWTRGPFSITADPYLRLGLANRGLGNRAALVLPLWLAVAPTRCWSLALHTGWDGELATIGDGWHVPIALAATARAGAHLAISVEAGFPSLLGPQNDFKQRAMAITVSYHR